MGDVAENIDVSNYLHKPLYNSSPFSVIITVWPSLPSIVCTRPPHCWGLLLYPNCICTRLLRKLHLPHVPHLLPAHRTQLQSPGPAPAAQHMSAVQQPLFFLLHTPAARQYSF